MGMWNPDIYVKAWNFACRAHNGQLVPGTNMPYINHVCTVAMEAATAVARSDDIATPDLLIQCALLHDVIEDTECTYDKVKSEFGEEVAKGVLALSKNVALPTKREQMEDSLSRIKERPREVWMVKMADRISNLQPPPHYWDREKIARYGDEAELILDQLGVANPYLAHRLRQKIAQYAVYLK